MLLVEPLLRRLVRWRAALLTQRVEPSIPLAMQFQALLAALQAQRAMPFQARLMGSRAPLVVQLMV